MDAMRSKQPTSLNEPNEWPQPPHRPLVNENPRGVLVADNEPGIRRLLEFALTQQGYQVWLAANGDEAVHLFKQHQASIGMALFDVVMPVLDGPSALKAIREIDPTVAFAFITGNSGQYTLDELEDLTSLGVFCKPFVLADLLDTVSRILGSRTPVSEDRTLSVG